MAQGKANNRTLVEQQSYNRVIDIFSEDNPESVYGLIRNNATFFKDLMKEIPDDLRDRDQYDIRNEINPTPTLNQLRLNFWAEYDRTIGVNGAKINLQNVCAGVCSYRLFRSFCEEPEKLAWILTPVQSYQAQAQDFMETALYKMRKGIENLTMSDTKELNTVIKIFEGFDKRMNGDYKKQIEVSDTREKSAPQNTEIKKEMESLGIQNDVVVEYNKEE